VEEGMMKKFVLMFIVLGLVSLGHAQILIGDFEGVGWPQDGWQDTWETTSVNTIGSGVGVTSGSQNLVVTPTASGFKWQFMTDTDVWRSTGIDSVSLDVTWVASEWATDGGEGDLWVKMDAVFAQGDGLGWTQVNPIDPCNPSYPGSWDPYYWGETHTRTLTYDFSGTAAGAPIGPSWSQLGFSINFGTNGGTITQMGNYYIDNIQLTPVPEPATMLLLGLGGLVLRRKRS